MYTATKTGHRIQLFLNLVETNSWTATDAVAAEIPLMTTFPDATAFANWFNDHPLVSPATFCAAGLCVDAVESPMIYVKLPSGTDPGGDAPPSRP